MPASIVHRFVCAAALAACALAARGADEMGPVHQPRSGEFAFNLLPKAFQRTPDLEMTVNTEVTDFGRLLRTPTPGNPVYYVSHDAGYKQMGDTVGGEHPPKPEQIDRAMQKALAASGYLPSTNPRQKPGLVVLYFWGSHNRLDPQMEAQFPLLAAKHRLERSILVGGHHQADVMARVLQWGENLTDRTPEYEYLRDQALDDLYFVVASAYDYTSLSHNQRKLVWRTTMTVSARGGSMSETLMPLIDTAGSYFGRDMAQPEIAMRRIQRWGVIMGEPKVVDESAATPKPAPRNQPQVPVKK